MKIYRPTTVKDFEMLKPGMVIIVEWDKFFVKHTEGAKKVMSYDIAEVKLNQNEIICRIDGNHYFNYMLYLGLDDNKSSAKDVLVIIDEDFIWDVFLEEF